MAVTTSHEDGFREIQLSGKQLVFLFMAVTVVLVVTFLTGVLVGRGVRAERSAQADADVITESPAEPVRATVTPPVDDPTRAAPPVEASEDPAPGDKPPVAIERGPAPAPKPVEPVKAVPAPTTAPPAAKPAPAKPAPAVASPPGAAPATAVASTAASAPVRNGYAVQVAAVKERGEADPIVKRLSGKGYDVYVEAPKGSQKMFRVRIGSFKTRREAQVLAIRLQKEEKLKPWVTR